MSTNLSAVIHPAKNVTGSLELPGDKSISHRYAMLAAIAEGSTKLENFSTGADCASTLNCLRELGVDWEKSGDTVAIRGRGPKLLQPQNPLDCGNSGSTMRMLSGILAGQEFTSELVGDESLSRRPMARIIHPLEAMGARITARDGRAPLIVSGGNLRAIEYQVPVPSAQVKTALLFAGLYAEGTTIVEEGIRTRDHGELALRAFGAGLQQRGKKTEITGGQRLHSIEARIPADISTAAFFLCAAALFPGSELVIYALLMNPTRTRLLDVLINWGMKITLLMVEEKNGELVGTIDGRGGLLRGGKIAGEDAAALIDEIPVLAAIAPYTSEGVEIRDARELRVKESDRIAAIAFNLRAMGAKVEEGDGGLSIPGNQQLYGAQLSSFGDHRIAMAFAVAALRAAGDSTIDGADTAVISYPAFFETLQKVAQR
ncbi:MAG: 3-phosphoshikimate 1-carboxyvinyltransferase [Acidobacteriales bacterium]|nr:3-phosphoshikimate 1-carboxyvinyltransferase [Terriglobales bacterium]